MPGLGGLIMKLIAEAFWLVLLAQSRNVVLELCILVNTQLVSLDGSGKSAVSDGTEV